MNHVVGIDIGGTKILGILLQEDSVTFSYEVPSDTKNSTTMLNAVIDCINQLLKKASLNLADCRAMGIGLPGLVDSTRGLAVYQTNIPWDNFPLVEKLSHHYGYNNIVIDNDVVMAAFNEWNTVNDTVNSMTYVTVSTGIACASIARGEVLRGNGFAGEIGHSFINHKGQYKRLEDVVSGPALSRRYSSRIEDDSITTRNVFDNYDSDLRAKHLIDEAAGILAVSIHQIISLLDPECIILGGSVMVHQPQFVRNITKHLEPLLLPDQRHVLDHIFVTHDAGNQGALGAAKRARLISIPVDRQ